MQGAAAAGAGLGGRRVLRAYRIGRSMQALWRFALVAPAGMTKAIAGRSKAGIGKAVLDPEVHRHFAKQAEEPVANTPVEFASLIGQEINRWGKAMKEAHAGIEYAQKRRLPAEKRFRRHVQGRPSKPPASRFAVIFPRHRTLRPVARGLPWKLWGPRGDRTDGAGGFRRGNRGGAAHARLAGPATMGRRIGRLIPQGQPTARSTRRTLARASRRPSLAAG